MKKQVSSLIKTAIILLVLHVMLPTLMAQPAPTTSGPFGSTLLKGANGETKYWDGAEWVAVAPGLPGQSLYFAPAWIDNSNGITTNAVTNITDTTATSGGTIHSDGGAFITARGVCWSTSHNPTIANIHTTDSTGIGSFISNLTGLTFGTTYYVRAYATSSTGTAYGNEVSFATTFLKVIDYDGNVYNGVTIGTQHWLTQNLNVTHYRNGEAIPNVTGTTAWSNLTTGAYCDYFNSPGNSTNYGRLYNWYTVVDSRNLCPTGFHVPSDADWTTLTDYLGGESVAGGKLKEAGISHWTSPNTGATNESGFTALPAGKRDYTGAFVDIGHYGYWWSSTQFATTNAWALYMYYVWSSAQRTDFNKQSGFSVRCLKD